jgi:hypothetical protein
VFDAALQLPLMDASTPAAVRQCCRRVHSLCSVAWFVIRCCSCIVLGLCADDDAKKLLLLHSPAAPQQGFRLAFITIPIADLSTFSMFWTPVPCNLSVFEHDDSRERRSDGSFARPQAVVSTGSQQHHVCHSNSFAIKQMRRCFQSRGLAAIAAMAAGTPSERCASIAVTSYQHPRQLTSTSTKRAPPPMTSSASCKESRVVCRTKQTHTTCSTCSARSGAFPCTAHMTLVEKAADAKQQQQQEQINQAVQKEANTNRCSVRDSASPCGQQRLPARLLF